MLTIVYIKPLMKSLLIKHKLFYSRTPHKNREIKMQLSNKWFKYKNLGLRGLLSLWSCVRTMWLLI